MGTENEARLVHHRRQTRDVHGADGLLFKLLKKAVTAGQPGAESHSGVAVGEKPHLMDKLAARDLRDFNATHSICLDAKRAASVGLGHREARIPEVLDPLTRFNWQDVLDAAADDYFETGEGFIEAVFGDPSEPRKVTFLNHLESAQVHIELEEEDRSEMYHYIVDGESGAGVTRVMAKWGDLADLKRRFGIEPMDAQSPVVADPIRRNANDVVRTARSGTLAGDIVNSEIIHIRQPTNRSRYYGFPDYMSAVPSIELVQVMTQHEFDFFFNRGVPEFLLFILGKNIGNCWDKIEDLLRGTQGLGNSHKTGAINIPGSPDEVEVQLEKLAMDESGNSAFADKSAVLDMRIATAHGMPPQLANIAIPGKMSATNEGPNAMLTFQMRKLGQAQKNFSTVLANTLGSDQVTFAQPTGEPVQLSADLFLGKNAKPMTDDGVPQFIQPGNGFNTILDGLTLGAQNTMASMREPMAGSARNPEAGLLEGARDRSAGDPRATRPAAS